MDIYNEGKQGYFDALTNPYEVGSEESILWREGWVDARQEHTDNIYGAWGE